MDTQYGRPDVYELLAIPGAAGEVRDTIGLPGGRRARTTDERPLAVVFLGSLAGKGKGTNDSPAPFRSAGASCWPNPAEPGRKGVWGACSSKGTASQGAEGWMRAENRCG